MVTLTFRQLQTNTSWMKQLPVAITRYGQIVAVISSPTAVTIEPIESNVAVRHSVPETKVVPYEAA